MKYLIGLLLVLPFVIGATRTRNLKKITKDSKEINVCDLEQHGSPIYCFCDRPQIRNATDVNCLIFDKFDVNDQVWNHFTSQIYMEKLTFKVKSGVSFTYVPTNVLKQLKNLQVVNFQYTTIDVLTEHAFSNHSSIAEIHLNLNAIVSLRKYSFENMRNLSLINLDGNQLTEINRDVFVNLPNLKKLLLNHNNITLVHDKAFKHLMNLEELELSNNQISVLTRESFHGLQNLMKLDLRTNLISMIGDNSFMEMTELKELQLDQNQIKYISGNALYGMGNLRKLSLSENKLVTLQPDFLSGAPNVHFLDLQDNSIKTVTLENIKPIINNLHDNTSYFYLHGNVLICDCKIAWLWTLRNETKNLKLREDLSELTCFFESQNVTQKLHNDAERIQALETARNPENYISDHLKNHEDTTYMDDATDYYDYTDDVESKHHSRSRQPKFIVMNGKTGYMKHLYELKVEDLPCPETSREDLMASEQPSGRHSNSARGSISIFSSFSSGKINCASHSVVAMSLVVAYRMFT